MFTRHLRSAGNYDSDIVSRETSVQVFGKDMAQQSSKEECDINVLVRRFGVLGVANSNVPVPTYQLFADVFDYQDAMNAVVAAERSFMAMSADVRARFFNDPHRFVQFCSDPKNLDEMRKMGLAVPKKSDTITSVVTTEGKDHGSGDSKKAAGGSQAASSKSGEGNSGE